jgi:hypothetical protein
MATILGLPGMSGLFAVTGTRAATWRSDVFRGQSVAAFGEAEPILKSHPYGLDAAAIEIRNDLAKAIPRAHAAAITRGYFDFWADAVSHAEHDGQALVFVVAERDPLISSDDWRAAYGPAEKVDEYIASLPKPLRRVVVVGINGALKAIRERADTLGIKLPNVPFFVSPDHPLLAECKADWTRWRDKNVRPIDPVQPKGPRLEKRRKQAICEMLQ